MRPIRLHSIAGGVAALLVLFVCGLSPRHVEPASGSAMTLDDPLATASDTVLPEGFRATVDRATSDRLVRVVAGDVDRDGDIDVVATEGSLDLIVWKNDGAGHFTRVPSSDHRTLQAQPPGPSVDGQPLSSLEWIQNDQPRGAGLAGARAGVAADPSRPISSFVRLSPGRHGPRLRSSRAPPIA